MPARLLSLFVRRPTSPDGAVGAPPEAVEEAAAPPAEAPPRPRSVAALRRERRALMRQREIELRDVGGLAAEMARRDRFRPELLLARCGDVLALEQRIHEIDSLLAVALAVPGGLRGARPCRCGAPIPRGAHFCAHCGRPAVETPPVAACAHCGQPLPADANFCAFCGNAVAAEEFEQEPVEATMVAPAEEGARGP